MAAPKSAIAVCTPTLGRVSMLWTKALIDLVWPMNVTKAFFPMIDAKGGEIAEVRNKLVSLVRECQKPDMRVESIFWLDDDVLTHRAVLLALASHDADVAAGVYFDKGEYVNRPLIFPGPSSGSSAFQPDQVIQSWGYAQGLSLVKLSVYERIEKECDPGKDKYGSTQFYKVPDFGFDKDGMLTNGGTEDFHFFSLLEKIGVKPVVDCTKFAFGWHFDGEKGHPVKQWEQLRRCEPVLWETKEGVVTWGN